MSGAAGTKVDFKRELDAYRAERGEFRLIEMPPTRYLMIDGHGDPNSSPGFAQAIESLYPLAYAMKFGSKRELGRDYVVPPLEGLWWADDMAAFTSARDKSAWDWTLMLMVPEWLGEEAFAAAVEQVRAKGGAPRLDEVRIDELSEGRCLQTLHVGSFDDETAVLDRLHHEIIPGRGLRLAGAHHEIYLSDFRRVAPEKQRTILRQPVVA
ncbi:GyrI-like domain-containing protein [Leucobacter sp.]